MANLDRSAKSRCFGILILGLAKRFSMWGSSVEQNGAYGPGVLGFRVWGLGFRIQEV